MYLNVAVLFISECLQHCFILDLPMMFYIGKSISVISRKLFWLDMSVCNLLDCNEDIFLLKLEYLTILHIILN